jgi:type VI secretion system secreted protein VgrG
MPPSMNATTQDLVRGLLQPTRLRVEVASHDALDVRTYEIEERMMALSRVQLEVRSKNHNLPFEEIIGQPATFSVEVSKTLSRAFRGICSDAEQLDVAPDGLATYRLTLVPTLWLLTQRRNYRIFQHLSDPDIALRLLSEWGIEHEVRFDRGSYKKRKYRVQYGESDFAFVCRMLEDAGVSFYFDASTTMVLSDAPDANAPHDDVPFNDQVDGAVLTSHVSDVKIGQRVRPGSYTLADHDYRRSPTFKLAATDRGAGSGVEALLERYHYVPGSFLFGSDQGEATPSADDRGKTRTDPGEGKKMAERRLQAKRASARYASFETTVFDLWVGDVLPVTGHPHELLAAPLLLLETSFSGTSESECKLSCRAVSAAAPYRPPLATPRPKVNGVESATVVGPAGEEIHTDEFGRVRVHFHWDRESKMNETSSCWIHVSQPWGGAGFGGTNLPRIGQEVIVDFLGGDPDRPVIVGRVYTNLQRTPYSLPGNKTRSGWRSNSSPGGGGYNELMFEDQSGSELLSMQAQKDMTTLVKNDQALTVKHDRSKLVENDETTVVKHDRTETVENDETITVLHDRKETVVNDETIAIGHDRKEAVANDESILIGHDRTRVVAHDDKVGVANDRTIVVGNDLVEAVGHDRARLVTNDEAVQIGKDQVLVVGENQGTQVGKNETTVIGEAQTLQVGKTRTVSVGEDEAIQIGANQTSQIEENQSTSVGGSHNLQVAKSSSEMVGLSKSITAGLSCSIQVGGMMSQTVGAMSTEQVGMMKRIQAGQSITLQCGAASIVLMASGEIILNGKLVNINGASGVKVTGEVIDLN